MFFDPAGEAAVQDPGGHLDPELSVADEEHAGLEGGLREPEEVHEGVDVELILVQRVLKTVLAAVELLRPLSLLFAAEDPAPVVLGFDDEDSDQDETEKQMSIPRQRFEGVGKVKWHGHGQSCAACRAKPSAPWRGGVSHSDENAAAFRGNR